MCLKWIRTFWDPLKMRFFTRPGLVTKTPAISWKRPCLSFGGGSNREDLPRCITLRIRTRPRKKVQVRDLRGRFTTRDLTSSHFERPSARFIFVRIEKKTHLGDNIRKEQEPLLPSPSTSPSSSDSPVDVKLRNILKDKTRLTDKPSGNVWKSCQ